ncbi:Alpha-tubulin N-acetyltransferase 1 [Podila epigama]|nr:Alpha-tubulin N-acetyltransferase 1 [Podila epigama]
MDFEFPLLPLLPSLITLVPASTFAALHKRKKAQTQIQNAYVSTVSIGLSSSVATTSTSPLPDTLSAQEQLGAIVDALGEASAKAQELPTSITQRQRLAQNPTQRVYILRTALEGDEDPWLDSLQIASPFIDASWSKNLADQPSLSTQEHTQEHTQEYTQEKARKQARVQIQKQEQEQKQDSGAETQNFGSSVRITSREQERGVYVAGMLKIGEKKLFVIDKAGTIHEQEVCCVLDFYIDSSCQRRGHGKLLFDYMLKAEAIEPNQIAYDRPSPKLYQFLSKHFGLCRHLPQPNQFAIFEGFILRDCGECIQVDDNAPLPSSSYSTRSLPSKSSSEAPILSCSQNHSISATLQIIPGPKQPFDTTSTNTNSPMDNNIRKSSLTSHRQLPQLDTQPSSTRPNEGTPYSMVTSKGTPNSLVSTCLLTKPNTRRVSSAFTSSINLTTTGCQGKNNSNSNRHDNTIDKSNAIGIDMTSITSASPGTSPVPAIPTGVGKQSRLLASSIVFSDSA